MLKESRKLNYKEERKHGFMTIPLKLIRYLEWKNGDEIEIFLVNDKEGYGKGIILKKKDNESQNIKFRTWKSIINIAKGFQKKRRHCKTPRDERHFYTLINKNKLIEKDSIKEFRKAMLKEDKPLKPEDIGTKYIGITPDFRNENRLQQPRKYWDEYLEEKKREEKETIKNFKSSSKKHKYHTKRIKSTII